MGIAAWYERALRALAVLAAGLIGGMALWVTYDVVARYFFQRPTAWALDLSEYAMLWSVFLSAPWLLRKDAHIRIDFFVALLAPAPKRRLGAATSLVGALVSATIAWQGALVCWDLYVSGIHFAREWNVPQYAVYVVIPFGAALLAVEFLARARRALRGGEAHSAHPPRPRQDLL